jgi:hypothetical protein
MHSCGVGEVGKVAEGEDLGNVEVREVGEAELSA